MELHNLTPFDVLRFGALDVHDEEHHVVAIKALYRLVRGAGEGSPPWNDLTHGCELAPPDDAGKLHLHDVYEGEPNASSVRAESDIAPCKPRCDVIVRATAWAPEGRPVERWTASLCVTAPPDTTLVDKQIDVCGPRWFERSRGRWSLTRPEQAASVPVRWERAFGGRSLVPGRRPRPRPSCSRSPATS